MMKEVLTAKTNDSNISGYKRTEAFPIDIAFALL
jgi:hypothetical protein